MEASEERRMRRKRITLKNSLFFFNGGNSGSSNRGRKKIKCRGAAAVASADRQTLLSRCATPPPGRRWLEL